MSLLGIQGRKGVNHKSAYLEVELTRSTANLLNQGSLSSAAALLTQHSPELVYGVLTKLPVYCAEDSIKELRELVDIILE